MQEFLGGSAFEQMAREYNAKYGKASVLESDFNNLTKEKEEIIKDLSKKFEDYCALVDEFASRVKGAEEKEQYMERELSKELGVPQKTINNRKKGILKKLGRILK